MAMGSGWILPSASGLGEQGMQNLNPTYLHQGQVHFNLNNIIGQILTIKNLRT